MNVLRIRSTKVRLTTAIALFSIALVGAPTGFAADEADQGAERPSSLELARQAAFRSSVGLRSDASYVEAIANSSSLVELGIPVTSDEAIDLRARGRAQSAISEFNLRVQGELKGFAGFFVDQQSGGTIVVMSTDEGAEQAESLISGAPSGVPARTEVAAHSYDELQTLQRRIDADRGALAIEGIRINGVGIDVPNNRVVAGVQPLTPMTTQRLAALYPSVALVDEPPGEVAACTSRNNCMNPLRAGIRVNLNPGLVCTGSFLASTGGTGSNVFWLTAGHCGSMGSDAIHSGSNVGEVKRWSWYPGHKTDSLAIDVANSQKSNLIYITSTDTISVTTRQPPTAEYPGQFVCHSGITTTIRCGTLWGSETQSFSGVLLYDVRRVSNLVVDHGDSGSPVTIYQTGTAVGIINGSNYTPPPNARGWYTHVFYAEQDLSLYVCRSMACTNF